jgi:peroxiredoxin
MINSYDYCILNSTRMRNVIINIIILTIIITGCSTDKDNFEVKGTVKDLSGTNIYLDRLLTAKRINIDSIQAGKNGEFSLAGHIDEPGFFVLFTEYSDYIHLIIHPDDHINIITNASKFDSEYIVEGSRDSKLVKRLVDKQRETLEKITKLSIDYENIKGEPDYFAKKAVIDSMYDVIFEEYKNFSIKMIEENPGSMVCIMALYQYLGINSPVFDIKDDFKYFNLVDSNLTALYPSSEAVKDLNRKVVETRENMKFVIGAIPPDISLPNPEDSIISLHSLRGNYVLLDFWASWSPLCRQANPELVRIYNKFRKKNFKIYQVSLDLTRESWLKGIEEDKLSWINVSDLKYWNSEAAANYKIRNLPSSFLLDTVGRIIAKNPAVKDLEKQLYEIYY